MDFEIVKENLVIKQTKEVLDKNIKIEQDFILPDNKPDIISVLCSNGNVYITKREFIGEKIKLEGGVCTYIAYLADNGENRVLNPNIVFAELIDSSVSGDDCSLIEDINIKKIDVKILNERKISVSIVLNARIKVFSKSNVEILNNINNCSDVQKLEKQIKVKSLVGSGETKAQIKENLNIDMQDEISDILNCNISLANIENKISYNKVLVKADCKLKIIYITVEGKVCSCVQTVPVMGFIDIMNVTDTNRCLTNFKIKNLLVSPNSKEEHSIYIEIDFDIFSDVYEDKEISLIEDIYSLKNNISFTKKNVNILSNDNEIVNSVQINEKVLIENINELFDVSYNVSLNNKLNNNGVVKFEGEVNLTYLFNDFNNQNIQSKDVNIGFSFDIPEDISNEVEVQVLDDASFIVLPDSTVESIININVIKNSDLGSRIDVIDNISIDDGTDDDAYSMIIYFAQKGDSLWKIAKKFKSTVNEIARINDITDESSIDVGQRLYIPRAV